MSVRPEEYFSWDRASILRLEGFWAEGYSTAEIGRRMGISKNSVVSKAHRLNLPGRASPIKRVEGRQRKPPTPKRIKPSDHTLPPLTTQVETARAAPTPSPAPAALAPEPEKEIAPAVRLSTKPHVMRGECNWPLGDARAGTLKFCGEPAIQGKPYCLGHCRVAYPRFGNATPQGVRWGKAEALAPSAAGSGQSSRPLLPANPTRHEESTHLPG